MSKLNQIVDKIEHNKAVIWALLLSSVVAKHAVGNIILIGIGLCFLLQWISNKKLTFYKSLLPLLIYFSFGSLSLLWTTNISATSAGISKGLYFLLIPIFISQFKRFSLEDLHKMMRFTGVILLAYFGISFVNATFEYREDGMISHFFYHDLTSISNNNAIYMSFLTSIVFLILFNLKNKTKLDIGICTGLFLYLIMLLSKNLIIITFLIQLILTYRLYKNRINKKNLLFFSLSFLVLLAGIVFTENPLRERFMEQSLVTFSDVWAKDDFFNETFNGLTLRLFQWRVFGEMILSGNIFLLGLGWNNIDYLAMQYFSYYNFYAGYFDINFHNQYLQTFGELGLLGLLILIYSIFKNFLKPYSTNIYLLLFTTIVVFSFLSESYLSRQKGVLIFVIFYCILVNLKKDENNSKKEMLN